MADISKPLVVVQSITNYECVGGYEETNKVSKVVEFFVLLHLLVERDACLHFASSNCFQSLEKVHHASACAVHVFHNKHMLSCDVIYLAHFHFARRLCVYVGAQFYKLRDHVYSRFLLND